MHFLMDDSDDEKVVRIPRAMSPLTHQCLLGDEGHLKEEDDDGSVEYKLKLVNVTEHRLQHLITQMKFRVAEGNGECLYELGVANNGQAIGLPTKEFDETLRTIKRMAASLKFEVTVLHERVTSRTPLMRCAEILVRRGQSTSISEVRVAMCGAIDAGKSTLIGVLTEGTLDDGRGSARQSVFTHKHELQSGHTSVVSAHFLGFDNQGRVVNLDPSGFDMQQSISERSSRIVALYDMAGSERYLSSTVTGFSVWAHDVGCVVVSATAGVQTMTKQQTALCTAHGIPWMAVVTKVDAANGHRLGETIQELSDFIRSQNKEPCIVEDGDDVSWSHEVVNIVLSSAVTGQGIDTIYSLLKIVPHHHEWAALRKLPTHVTLTNSRVVNDVGLVFFGLVNQGVMRVHETVQFGPTSDGQYIPVKIRSIHVKGFPTHEASAGSCVSLALEGAVTEFRHGVVLTTNTTAGWRFTAELFVLRTNLRVSSQPIIHCKGIRQCAVVTNLKPREGSEEGDNVVLAEFTFLYRPECIHPGSRVTVMLCGVAAIGTVLTAGETPSV